MFGYATGAVVIRSGKNNGRSIYDVLMEGRITITGTDGNGKQFQRIAEVHDGEIWDTTLKENGETVHRIAYGKFEKIKLIPEGTEVVRFKKGTGRGKHGKSFRDEILFGHPGRCHSWYKNGRLVRQKFIYDNRRAAYDYNAYKKQCTIKDPDGYVLYEIKGILQGRLDNAFRGCHSVFSEPMELWFMESSPFEVKREGILYYAGQEINHQKAGKWVVKGRTFYYEHGVGIPKKLFETPPDKLDPAKILKIDNAQLRMALMEKIGPERIADIGKVVHKDGDMRLYDIPKYDARMLRVRCPTTKAFYYLRVPKDAKKCEEARQWTFHVGQDIAKPIKFAVET